MHRSILMITKWITLANTSFKYSNAVWKLLSRVRLFVTPWTVQGCTRILQASIVEWVAVTFSKGSSWPRDQIQVSCIAGGFFSSWAIREAHGSKLISWIDWLLLIFFWNCLPRVVESFKNSKRKRIPPWTSWACRIWLSSNWLLVKTQQPLWGPRLLNVSLCKKTMFLFVIQFFFYIKRTFKSVF